MEKLAVCIFLVGLLTVLAIEEEEMERQILNLETTMAEQRNLILEQNVKISEQNTKIVNQENKICAVERNIISEAAYTRGGQGTTFVRWGRVGCPTNTSIVYSGYASGSHFRSSGGAAEFICLPDNPVWGSNKDFKVTYTAAIYGAEYEGEPYFFGMGDTRQDVPCVICDTNLYSMALMIPGRTECYDGWSVAYVGELASGYPNHKAASQFICVDANPKSVQRTDSYPRDDNGKLLYPVKAKCGALPCPPYENNALLSCVVCLK